MLFVFLLVTPALAQTGQLSPDPTLLPPYRDNAHGPGINSVEGIIPVSGQLSAISFQPKK
jgi:hypothetical protein